MCQTVGFQIQDWSLQCMAACTRTRNFAQHYLVRFINWELKTIGRPRCSPVMEQGGISLCEKNCSEAVCMLLLCQF